MSQYVVCPSVCPVRPSLCPSVTFRYRDHIGWNTSKTISRPNSLRYIHIDLNIGDLDQREYLKN